MRVIRYPNSRGTVFAEERGTARSAAAILRRRKQAERSLKSWFKRGIPHLLGSDGHSPNRRAPRMAAAYQRIIRWAGSSIADRVCSTNGMAVLQGLPVRVPQPEPPPARWLHRLW